MNWENWNKWLTLGANLGVFIGFIMVAYEIHQSQTQLELAALADSSDNFTQAMQTLAQDKDLSELIYHAERNFEDLDEFEKWRVSKYLDGYMIMSEQDYLVLRQMNDERGSASFEYDWSENMKMPLYRDYWLHNQTRFSHEFREFIDGIVTEMNQSQGNPMEADNKEKESRLR